VEGTDVYATMLNMTDLTQGQSGRNSFYLMMIVTNAKKNKFVLFRKWGRVGQEDAPTTEGEYSKDDAIAEFERIFFEKTKNTWDQFLEDTYEKKPGKFFPIELGGDEEEPVDDAKLKRAKEILQAGTTCKLDSRVQELVKLLFDTNMFKEQMKEMKIDVKKVGIFGLRKLQLKLTPPCSPLDAPR
jgi:predicted DNA-binding WGR domain protein